LIAVAGAVSQAQSAASLSQVHKIYVEPFTGKRGASEIRDNVIGRLKHDSSLTLVPTADQADAVLKGNGEIWTTGYIGTNPRDPGGSRSPVYTGYLSLTLEGSKGQALWSYLVTPTGSLSAGITSNLAGHGAKLLASAVSHEKGANSTASPAADSATTPSEARETLKGAGSTFAAPLYQAWIESFHQLHDETRITYAAVGSEKGIEDLLAKQVDFAASDVPESPNGATLQRFATVLGAVVPIYNLDGLDRTLRFTPEILSGIYLGKITRWNDPAIRAANRGANLPNAPIAVVHRADGSGTTYAFTDYLAKTSAEWKPIGAGPTVQWPVGAGATGNDGVAAKVQQTPNSIGYVELTYAIQHELSYGSVRNSADKFIAASLETVAAAAKSTSPESQTPSASITNAPGKDAYPIASFTWIVLPAPVPGNDRNAIVQLLQWMLTSGQKQSSALGYTPLPKELAARELQSIAQIK
jgi:phosphate ABC transporter phosphate-binding protein